ncbi:MAG: M56 family metallopeptidase [Deltaproteobacteria bacterium]|nr:M56 family metallopeptidase [Deltaproteobacteria bacterium]
MSGPDLLSIVGGVILDAGLKSAAVLALGGLGALLLRGGSAAQRHAVWAGSFAALPLLVIAGAQRGPAIAVDVTWLAPLWLAGAAFSALPLLRGLAALVRLQRTARPDPLVPDLRHSPALTSPVTWGLWRPIILLPTSAAAWPAAQRAAALAHEQAHVDRRDWAVHIAAWSISALFWFNPLVWFARRTLAQEAEQAADDAALAKGARPSDYARLLLSLHDAGPAATGPAAALGASTSPLGQRLRAVLEPRPRSPERAWALGFALLLSGGAAAALGAYPTWTRPPDTLTCSPGPTP